VRNGVKVYIVIVVDDTLITSADDRVSTGVMDDILSRFPGKSSDATWYCGMKLNWQPDGSVILSQRAHIEQIMDKFGLQNCTLRTLPLAANFKVSKEGEPLDTCVHHYAGLVGALLYLAVNTRPDIAASVNKLAKFMSCPTMEHWHAAVSLVGYLRYTIDYGLHLGRSDECIAYCDADYASDLDQRRSHTGWCFMVYGGTVSWQSKCQPTVAASTTEAEYQAAATAAREALWLRQLLPEFDIPCKPMTINCDSQGALKSMRNPQITQRTKHIDVIHHFVRERCQRGEIEFQFVPGMHNVADVLTKALPGPKHKWCCEKLGVVKLVNG
jgi:hypothetical protein